MDASQRVSVFCGDRFVQRRTMKGQGDLEKAMARLHNLSVHSRDYKALSSKATLDSLSPELLAEIFRYVVQYDREWAGSMWDCILLVCHLWRDIAINSPQLWTTIPTGWPSSYVQAAIERSGILPLTVTTCDDQRKKVHAQSYSLLFPHFWRIQSASLNDGRTYPTHLIQLSDNHPSCLEELSISMLGDSGTLAQTLGKLSFPKLTLLCAHRVPLVDMRDLLLRSPQISTLSLAGCATSAEDLLNALQNLPLLESLELIEPTLSTSSEYIRPLEHAVRLPRLRYLNAQRLVDNENKFSDVLRFLEIPSSAEVCHINRFAGVDDCRAAFRFIRDCSILPLRTAHCDTAGLQDNVDTPALGYPRLLHVSLKQDGIKLKVWTGDSATGTSISTDEMRISHGLRPKLHLRLRMCEPHVAMQQLEELCAEHDLTRVTTFVLDVYALADEQDEDEDEGQEQEQGQDQDVRNSFPQATWHRLMRAMPALERLVVDDALALRLMASSLGHRLGDPSCATHEDDDVSLSKLYPSMRELRFELDPTNSIVRTHSGLLTRFVTTLALLGEERGARRVEKVEFVAAQEDRKMLCEVLRGVVDMVVDDSLCRALAYDDCEWW